MTRFSESAKRTISDVKNKHNGWFVTFVDGSCQLIKTEQRKGFSAIEPGRVIESCRKHCAGPDENGKCTLHPHSRSAAPECHEQFIYVRKSKHSDKPAPKFERCIQKMSYRIKKYRTIKDDPESWEITFENGTTKILPKSAQLGRGKLKHGQHVVPCGEECTHRGGECVYCHGDKRGMKCAQQFYFCRKFLCRHKNDKSK